MANAVGIVDGVCRPAKVPIIAGESAICQGCGVATLSIDYYDLGYATGKMAAEILKGDADIATMPIGYVPEEELTPMYNAEICEELGLTVLDGYTALG